MLSKSDQHPMTRETSPLRVAGNWPRRTLGISDAAFGVGAEIGGLTTVCGVAGTAAARIGSDREHDTPAVNAATSATNPIPVAAPPVNSP